MDTRARDLNPQRPLSEAEILVMPLDEAARLRGMYVEELTDLDAQLASRRVEMRHRDQRVRDQYFDWRAKAVRRHGEVTTTLIRLKARVTALRQANGNRPPDYVDGQGRARHDGRVAAQHAAAFVRMQLNPDDPLAVLVVLYDMAQYVVNEAKWDTSVEERAVLAAAHRLVVSVPVEAAQ